MAIQRGSPILASDVIDITGSNSSLQGYGSDSQALNRLAALYGVGYGTRGYGQTGVTVTPVNARHVVRGVDWSSMSTAIQTCANHLGVAVPLPPDNTLFDIGDVITAVPYNYKAVIQQLDSSRLVPDPTNLATTVVLTDTRTARWTTSVALEVLVSWGSEDQTRYFFNSGGSINLEAALTAPGNAISMEWSQMLSRLGVVQLGAQESIQTVGTSSTSYALGYYNITDSYRQMLTLNGTGAYAANQIVVSARRESYQGTRGSNGSQVRILLELNNRASSNVLDFVSGNLSSQVSITRAVNHLQIASPTVIPTRSLSDQGGTPEFTFNTLITGTVQNYNLLSAAQSAGWSSAMISAQIPLRATVIVDNSAVVVGSSTSNWAFVIPDLPVAGSTVQLTNRGFIVGRGGAGGGGGASENFTPGSPGQTGGPALLIQYDTVLINAGVIAGGGGGGGGGGGRVLYNSAGSGGGGAAFGAGAPGTQERNGISGSGQNGTLTQGGAGGCATEGCGSRDGGTGGDLGQPGASGQGTPGVAQPGGAAGVAIQGLSRLMAGSVWNGTDIRGPRS